MPRVFPSLQTLGIIRALALPAVAAAILVGCVDGQGDRDSTATVAPSATETPTPTACSPGNLVEGFLLLGADKPLPDCLGRPEPIPAETRRYEIAVPPGPYYQVAIEEPDWDGWRYLRTDTDELAFAIYRSRWVGLPGRVLREAIADVEPVDYMPGDAVRVRSGATEIVWWQEGYLTYGLEVSAGATGLDLEQTAALLWYFSGSSGAYWDPAVGAFRVDDRTAWLYDETATTGIPVIDAEIADGPSASGEGTIMAPCEVDPTPAILRPPPCPAGAAAGTLVEAYLWVNCPGMWAPVHLDIGPLGAIDGGWLYAVVEASDPMLPELRYLAVYTTGERIYTVLFSDSRVLGAGGGGGCPTPELVPWARSIDSWILPPLYPLPPAAP